MKIKRFRKTNDQLKEEIRDAFTEIFDSYEADIRNSWRYTYNFCVVIQTEEKIMIHNKLELSSDEIPYLLKSMEYYSNIYSLISESTNRLKDTLKSCFIVHGESGISGIVVHLRMHFT